MADRSFPGERQAGFIRVRRPDDVRARGNVTGSGTPKGCDPLSDINQVKNQCQDPNNQYFIGHPTDPSQYAFPTGGDRVPVDPNLQPQSADEIAVGGEYEVISDGRIGVNYSHRYMNNVIEDMSRDEAQTYFITNPGEGSTRDFPKPQRTYDAGTIFLQKVFSDNWELLASYTLSYLRGNYVGLFRPETLQLDPLTNSDYDLKSLTQNRNGPLPGDTRHQFKVFGSRTVELSEHSAIQLGGAARGTSGAPTSYLGSHPIYGPDEVFILPRGEGNRLPWTYSLDTSIGYVQKFNKDQSVTFTIDVFNLLNFQEITQRDETYTTTDVNPIINGSRSDLGQLKNSANGALLQKKEVNPNFGNPTSYQAPRQFRVGIRGTF